MKKQKAIVSLSLLSIYLLTSCSETSSGGISTTPGPIGSDSSNGGQVVEPAEITNLQRTGELNLTVGLGEDNPIVNYNSPLLYSYQTSTENIDTASEIKLLPTQVTKDGETDIDTIKANYNALGLIMNLVGEYADQSSVNLASAYYNDLSSKLTADTLRTEELAIDFIGDKAAFVNTSTSGSDTSLRSYAETDLPQVDMSMITSLITLIGSISEQASEDLITLLKTIDTLLPDETILRPILSIIGDAADLIGNGLSINLEGDAENSDIYYVNVYLNDEGVPLANELLVSLLGDTASSLSLDDFSLDITLKNSDEKNGLLTDLNLDIGLSFNSLSLPVQLDFTLGTDEQEISKTYFSDAKFALSSYAEINNAVDEFYSPIKNYVQLPENSLISLIKLFGPLMGLDFEFGFMTSNVSLTQETGDMLTAASQQIDTLGNDVEFILGGYITKDNLLTEYNKGIEIVSKAVSDYSAASKPSISSDNIGTYFSSMIEYADWSVALSEQGGADLLSSLNDYLSEIMSSAENALSDLNTAISQETIDENSMISKYGTFITADKNVTDTSQYFYGDTSASYESYSEDKASVLETMQKYQTTSINSKISALTDYSSLQSMFDSDFYSTLFSDGSSTMLSSESTSKITSILQDEATALKTALLASFKTSANKTEFTSSYDTYKNNIQTFRSIEQSFLGVSTLYDDLNTFGTFLNDNLPD